ncbi:hypothetical protein EGM70_03640 [Enterobacteriaceae bacterium 89]|nr:hypothetical protein [Enterobacteriaceae bacterium 89]
MNVIFKTALCGLFFLYAGQGCANVDSLATKSISVPAWNIISDTLLEMTPLIDDKRDDFLMNQICSLARGQRTQEEVNEVLIANKISVTRIPKSAGTLSLLINHEKAQQQVACTVYLATSVFQPVDTNDYWQFGHAGEKKRAEKPSRWLFWADESSVAEEKRVFNSAAFLRDGRVRIAVTQATAQLYAVIAANLSSGAQSYAQYQQQIRQIVASYAEDYLKSVQTLYQAKSSVKLSAEEVQATSFTLVGGAGERLVQTDSQPLLTLRGVTWFGDGKILGKEYMLDLRLAESNVLSGEEEAGVTPAEPSDTLKITTPAG